MTDSYYDVLGVDPDASETEIKRAFRETIKEVHPDHNDDADAGDQFRRVREARDTLCDPTARQQYDQRRTSDQHGTDDTEPDTDSMSSHEWAREQQRQQRKQQQRQHAEHRRQRQRRQQRQQRQTQTTAEGESQGRTRASRRTNTQTREREETASEERAWHTTTDHPLEERLRAGGAWLRERIPRPRQWLWTRFHSSDATKQFLIDVATSPTTIRLSAALVLILTLTVLARAGDLSPATTPTLGFVIVLGSLVASYTAYAVATPLPFEAPRNHSRFKPASRTSIWPAIALNGTGLGLIGLAALNGAPYAGIGFTVTSSVYAGLLLAGISLAFTMLATVLIGVVQGHVFLREALKHGLGLAPLGTALVLFTHHPGGGTLRAVIQDIVGPASTTPWIPPVMFGPVYLGSLANFGLAVVCLGCLLGSVITMWRYLTVVPWRDRYDHGYQLHPSLWNLAVTAPTVILAWMVGTNVSAVTLGPVVLTQLMGWIGVFILPTLLPGAYILRRQLEPRLQAAD